MKWDFQYTINDSGFTQEQLNAINSGISKSKVEKLNALPTQGELQAELDGKLNKTDELSLINDNEISNYVRFGQDAFKDALKFSIGKGSKASYSGSIAIGANAQADKSSTVVGY